ncbi:MAG: hypothetical protein K6E75_12680 [Lachnospiraceae bacterium]|nr:hypothetical protein [Lachnospiraceae bacterium]
MNAKNAKLYGKRALSLFLFAAGIIVISRLLQYPLVDDTASQSRVTFHDYYETNPIDILFVGPSHSVHIIDAVQMTDQSGEAVFNLSTKGQLIEETYSLIKDAVENRGIRRICCELSITRLKKVKTEQTAVYIVTDYYKNALERAKLIFKLMPTGAYLNTLSLRRGMDPLSFSISKPFRILKKKQDPAYTGYQGTNLYKGRGEWAIYDSPFDAKGFAYNVKTTAINHFTTKDIDQERMDHIRKIIRVCRENNTQLVFYIPPYSEVYKQEFEEYWEITDQVKKLVLEEGALLIDLNLVKDEYLSLNASDFYELDHANSYAGERISAFLTQYLREPEGDYFQDTIEEKYPDQDAVTAVAYLAEFQTDQGIFYKADDIKGTLQEVKLTVRPQGYHPIKAQAGMWAVTYDPESDSYTEGEEVTGTVINDQITEFIIPGEDFGNDYLIRLYDPDTKEQIYRAYTRFDKD